MTQASIGVALICKDAAATLGACLDSVRPYVKQIVVAVDTLTTDGTEEVAKKHGADVVVPVQVSDWHECPGHGRVLAQHFARARNEAFKHLDPNLSFWGWLDSDDILAGGEHLAAALAAVPEDACGVWLSYVYASSNNYQSVSTVFDRERLLRTRWKGQPLRWTWEYRVHEVVKPVGVEPVWVREDRVKVLHQEGVHKSQSSGARNLLLLEIDLEETGPDPRTLFYIANQYFAMNDMPRAAEWYERRLEVQGADYEAWQAAVYLSISYERMGDLDNATRTAFWAIDLIPDHPEPYFRLASVYCQAGEFAKALRWDKEARTKRPPPNFVFVNPMDYTYNSKTVLADAYAKLGHIPEARALLEQAHAVAPGEHLAKSIAHYKQIEADAKVAQAFVDLATGLPDEKVVALYADLPEGVKAFGRTRDLAVPAMLRIREARYAA